MAQKVNEDDLKLLCELASHEQGGKKLLALTNEIIALLDAKHGKPSALPQPKK